MVVDTLVVVSTLVVGNMVDVAISVTVTVRIGMLPSSSCRFFSKFNLCCAPAKSPMNMELNRRNMRAMMRRAFVRAVRGSCTREVR